MKQLIAFARSARGASALAVGTAILAAGVTAKIEYDADADELRLSLRKVKPIMRALSHARATATS